MRPQMRNAQMCWYYPLCCYGDECWFAHDQNELVTRRVQEGPNATEAGVQESPNADGPDAANARGSGGAGQRRSKSADGKGEDSEAKQPKQRLRRAATKQELIAFARQIRGKTLTPVPFLQDPHGNAFSVKATGHIHHPYNVMMAVPEGPIFSVHNPYPR